MCVVSPWSAEDAKNAKARLRGFTNITIHRRREFAQLQLEFRAIKGTSVIVYDQTCAAEKRRRRKRGLMPESSTRVFINAEVCEGCGDCSTTSNCLSVLPKKTELGVKRQIDQSACNKDFTCLDGFCPSFVTVTGATLRSGSGALNESNESLEVVLPVPALPQLERPWNILVTGIGGTGVLTVGSLVAMAAHIEGQGCATLNQTGLAQKFGAVVSHVRIAKTQAEIHAVRIPEGDADVLLGCDLVVSAMPEALARLDAKRSHSVVNTYENPTADFIHDAHYQFPGEAMRQVIREETGAGKTAFVNATRIARDLLGNSIGGNLFLLGFAWQRGLIPVSNEAINRAIELNDVAVEFNRQAFLWGRRAAVNLAAVENLAGSESAANPALTDLDDVIAWRQRYLSAYQNRKYADKYRALVERIRAFENRFTAMRRASAAGPANPANLSDLTEAVARNYFKLLAYKDEYEIARLYSNGDFIKNLEKQFAGPFKLNFHLAPPLLARKDPLTGHLIKRRFPGFTLKIFAGLARLKFLRGTRLDVFGHSPERKQERRLITEYENDLAALPETLNADNYATAVAIAKLPEMVKGFGHIKRANIEKYRENKKALFKKFRAPDIATDGK